jgi:DNA recombination protein RmuC
MDPVSLVIGIIFGLIVGGVIAWLLAGSRVAQTYGKLEARDQETSELKERIGQMNVRLDELTSQLKTEAEKRAAAEATATRTEELDEENDRLEGELSRIKADYARLQETIKKEREAVEEKLALVKEAETKLSDAFKALSSEALKSNNQAFIDLAKETLEKYQTDAKSDLTARQKAIDTLVQPLRENLDKYQQVMAEMAKERSGQYTSLQDQVKTLLESEQCLRDETSKLVTALSAPQVRGHWGEITLRRVAELAGMVEHCDFIEQESTESEKGRLRPDMIVSLPNGRRIVIDAKSPLKAYMEAVEATTDDEREAKILQHAKQVKTRVQDLSKKEYWDQFDDAPEFAVLFLPGEQFLGAALQKEPGLLEEAFRQKVILATPTTLVALLKAVAYGWRQEALAENAQQISELGKQLYDRLATLASHLEDLGKNLDRSVAAFNRAVGSYESRVAVTARKFKELGATAADDIPPLEPIEQTTRTITPVGYEISEDENQPKALS